MSGQGAELQITSPHAAAFAGDVTPQEAWEALAAHKDAMLVDVRTIEERIFAGEANLDSIGKHTLSLPWKLYPTMTVNELFIEQLASLAPHKNAPLYFMCKVGGRSTDAAIAATQAGWAYCYNIADGFEGSHNTDAQRGSINGWKASALAWRQN